MLKRETRKQLYMEHMQRKAKWIKEIQGQLHTLNLQGKVYKIFLE